MEKKSSEEIKAEMDAAAKIAEVDLKKLDKKSVEVVGVWLKKHYLKAGYKRLGRLLIK
jgi:hypothetical protein